MVYSKNKQGCQWVSLEKFNLTTVTDRIFETRHSRIPIRFVGVISSRFLAHSGNVSQRYVKQQTFPELVAKVTKVYHIEGNRNLNDTNAAISLTSFKMKFRFVFEYS